MTLRILLSITLALMGGAAHAQVFKCADATGKVTYSQAPCPGAGQLLDGRRPSSAPPAELTQRREVERARRAGAVDQLPQQAVGATPGGSQCLDAQEVRNIQAAATSIRLDALDRQVQAEQVRRARNCEPLMSDVEMQGMKDGLRAQRRASRPEPPPMPSTITSCDLGGCWGSDGARYNSTGPGQFVRQDGATCRRTGNTLTCN